MDTSRLVRMAEYEWWIEPKGAMRVPGILYADETLVREMDEKVYDQVANVAGLPGIVKAAMAMPDAHWGYGFPIGGVGAFDAQEGGVVSAGGVGFDISCGVRTLLTGLPRSAIEAHKEKLAETLFHKIPAGVGSTGRVKLNTRQLDAMLNGGAQWAVAEGYGVPEDVERIESRGRVEGADPSMVSPQAKQRQEEEMGTLGSGNHYLEVQEIRELYDERLAAAFGLRKGEIVVSIHCGSRGLGHQVATDYSKKMLAAAAASGIRLPDRELACAPIESATGQAYLGAMRAAINCALANRQILAHLVREAFAAVIPNSRLSLLYDVSHNTCRLEEHVVDGRKRTLHVHRKGATSALAPGHPDLAAALRDAGQPVLIGGTMGTASYILAGLAGNSELSFSSACHGAGRQMSRTQATKQWQGRKLIDELADRGILIRCKSYRGVAEEAPGAYKDVSAVVEATAAAGLAAKVARLAPLICVKG
ncbi:MAG TPA: RNA-splicing ligase RtcB [Verrucomicrobia bacterium]|nr:MAG: RNA-splicing ligase RtcB [Lentisphaerae bacterium GWF2_57_35]HBA83982.1 RNA-splicing ligase RtcB [Verrucomicrobiota bacterium]